MSWVMSPKQEGTKMNLITATQPNPDDVKKPPCTKCGGGTYAIERTIKVEQFIQSHLPCETECDTVVAANEETTILYAIRTYGDIDDDGLIDWDETTKDRENVDTDHEIETLCLSCVASVDDDEWVIDAEEYEEVDEPETFQVYCPACNTPVEFRWNGRAIQIGG
jgi:hypothetical protein